MSVMLLTTDAKITTSEGACFRLPSLKLGCVCMLLAALMMFTCACGNTSAPPSASDSSGLTASAVSAGELWDQKEQIVSERPAESASQKEAPIECFFDRLADRMIRRLELTENDDDWSTVKKAYLYVMSNTYYIDYDNPILTGSWQYMDKCGTAPTPYQIMATSPLVFGIGSCENYACALMLILERLGYETYYVPGTTYTVERTLIEHAWVMVNLEGAWYHLDPQLEDNTSYDQVSFRFYLKSDEVFSAHHYWGNRLSNATAYDLSLPECPASAPQELAQHYAKADGQTLEEALEQAERIRHQAEYEPAGIMPEEVLPPFPAV